MLALLFLLTMSAPCDDHEGIAWYAEMVENSASCRVVRDEAVRFGLEKAEADELAIDIGSSGSPPAREIVERWEREFNLFRFLTRIIALEAELPFHHQRMRGGPHGVDVLNVLNWMGRCRAPEKTRWVIDYVKKRMRDMCASDDKDRFIWNLCQLILVLGNEGSDEALDILFALLSEEAWAGGELPVPIAIEEIPSEERKSALLSFRKAAMMGIAYSGTDRALHAFATGEGLAGGLHLDEGFHICAHRRFGIGYFLRFYAYVTPDPELIARIEAVYRQYGKEYNVQEEYASQIDDMRSFSP